MGRVYSVIPVVALSLAIHVGVSGALFVITRPPRNPAPPAIATLAGETFELTDPLQIAENGDPVRVSVSVADSVSDAVSVPHGPFSPKAHTSSQSQVSAVPSLYGAVGDRSAADIATSFTRAFPQASSADPAWNQVPFGSLGHIDLTLRIDDSGKLVTTNKGAGHPLLARAIDRTLALIAGRVFTGSAPVIELRISGNVSADEVHDGLHGDVFAIGGSYAGGQGSAFFALNSGRRIDIEVHAIRR